MPSKQYYQDHLDCADWEGGLAEYILGYGASFERDPELQVKVNALISAYQEVESYLQEKAYG